MSLLTSGNEASPVAAAPDPSPTHRGRHRREPPVRRSKSSPVTYRKQKERCKKKSTRRKGHLQEHQLSNLCAVRVETR